MQNPVVHAFSSVQPTTSSQIINNVGDVCCGVTGGFGCARCSLVDGFCQGFWCELPAGHAEQVVDGDVGAASNVDDAVVLPEFCPLAQTHRFGASRELTGFIREVCAASVCTLKPGGHFL